MPLLVCTWYLSFGHDNVPQWQESRSCRRCHTSPQAGQQCRGARDLHCLSACDLEALEQASMHSQIWQAAGVSVANSGRNGSPNLALVQELSR